MEEKAREREREIQFLNPVLSALTLAAGFTSCPSIVRKLSFVDYSSDFFFYL